MLDLIKIDDPTNLLWTPTIPYVFAEHSQKETEKLAKDIVEAMYRYKGVGISANQLGIKWSIFAFRAEPDYVCFNPVLAYQSDDKSIMDEACLSWPWLIIKMKRSNEIRLRFQDHHGESSSFTFKGMTARVITHEMQHINGNPWFEGANRIHIERGIRQAKRKKIDYSGAGLLSYAS